MSKMNSHEGTWLSVAVGAYCASRKNKLHELAKEMSSIIWEEIIKERSFLLELKNDRENIAFVKATPLVAHNLGDLDRVIVQWNMQESDPFCKKIFKLGHILRDKDFSIFIISSLVNKAFTSAENHRHMSLRRPKCLRKSNQFLIPVGPFMDDWGRILGKSKLLEKKEKAEIIIALYDGYLRQEQAMGYCRAYGGLLESFTGGLREFEKELPFDVVSEIKKSVFFQKLFKYQKKNLKCLISKN